MSDAITSVLTRRIVLNFARAALKSGSKSDLEKALASLPKNGEKAAGLRAKIEAALHNVDDRSQEGARLGAGKITCVSDGIAYQFFEEDFGSLAFFKVSRNGSVVNVTINRAHPFGSHVVEGGKLFDPIFLRLLAAWAHYELDQISPKARDEARIAREDWSRVLIRLSGHPMDLQRDNP